MFLQTNFANSQNWSEFFKLQIEIQNLIECKFNILLDIKFVKFTVHWSLY